MLKKKLKKQKYYYFSHQFSLNLFTFQEINCYFSYSFFHHMPAISTIMQRAYSGGDLDVKTTTSSENFIHFARVF